MWGSCWFGIVKEAWPGMTVKWPHPLPQAVMSPHSKNLMSVLQEGFVGSVTWCQLWGQWDEETNSILASTVTSPTPKPGAWCTGESHSTFVN